MVQCVLEIESMLGESPLWDPNKKLLYWIDILKKQIHAFDPEKKINTSYNVNETITAIAHKRDGKLLVTQKKKICSFDFSTSQCTNFNGVLEIEKDQPNNRFNDAKCDRRGRFWAGTMNDKEREKDTGALYRIDALGTITCMANHLNLTNGMGWSPDNSKFYLMESLKYAIFVYDFDIDQGTISNRRLFAKVDEKSGGCPDGLTVDLEGYVWSAQPGLGRIVRYNPNGKIDGILELPVPRPSSCAFGGENLCTLYITTARELMSEADLKKYPLSGSLFTFDPGVKGIPEPIFSGV